MRLLAEGEMGAVVSDTIERFRAEWIAGHLDRQRANEALEHARQRMTEAGEDPERLRRARLELDRAERHLLELDASLGERFDRFCGLTKRAAPTSDESLSASHGALWRERLVGFGLVAGGLTAFSALAVPQVTASWLGCLMIGAAGACGIFFGMPLLVTGRIRQLR